LGYHTLVPVGTALWWMIWGGKALRWGQLPYWLLWPLGYCVYALIRGGFEGDYPYFFLDVGRFGAARIAMNIAGLVVVFALMGVLIVLVARLMRRAAPD
ncbi:MAG: Pr6Pr family membrane protein, partial [Rhodobacteraceae bacterium]|nr:Pr6Pr family membrane protein [Paracoccaceae bacterium]